MLLHSAGGLCCGPAAAGGSEASLGSIYPGGPSGPAGIDESYSTTAGDDLRDMFLLCPKCVLLRHAHPGSHCINYSWAAIINRKLPKYTENVRKTKLP